MGIHMLQVDPTNMIDAGVPSQSSHSSFSSLYCFPRQFNLSRCDSRDSNINIGSSAGVFHVELRFS